MPISCMNTAAAYWGPDAREFRPERWLEPAGAVERNQLFFAFAAGGRGCIGKQ